MNLLGRVYLSLGQKPLNKRAQLAAIRAVIFRAMVAPPKAEQIEFINREQFEVEAVLVDIIYI